LNVCLNPLSAIYWWQKHDKSDAQSLLHDIFECFMLITPTPSFALWLWKRLSVPHRSTTCYSLLLQIFFSIPFGCASGNIDPKPGMSHYIPCLITE
jgi:hypothetical protein